MNLLITLFLFILFSSCSYQADRKPAAAEDNHKEQRQKAFECYHRTRKICYRSYPYNEIKRKWYQFEYQWLNKRNEKQLLYNRCNINGSIMCSEKFGLYKDAARMRSLKNSINTDQELAAIRNNTFWGQLKLPGLDMSSVALTKIFKLIKSFKKAYDILREQVFKGATKGQESLYKLLHGFGISTSGTAILGAGGTMQYELVIHKGKMALFCAPGVTVKTDIGLNADLGMLKTLGCKDNKDYRGKFLTFDAGLSGELIGLPVGIGGSYSLGMDVTNYLEELKEANLKGHFSLTALSLELADFFKTEPGKDHPSNMMIQNNIIYQYIVWKFMVALVANPQEKIKLEQDLERILGAITPLSIFKMEPLSNFIKLLLKRFIAWEEKSNKKYPQIRLVLEKMDENLSACDALSGNLGLSLSLSPVSFGMILYHYNQMAEIDLRDLTYLASFTPRTLLNMELKQDEIQKMKDAMTRVLRVFPDLASNKCLYESGTKFYQDGKNIIEILR